MLRSIPSLDPLIRKFSNEKFAHAINGAHGSWRAKVKEYLTTYALAADMYVRGGQPPDEARTKEIQDWLDGQYAWLDELQEAPGWKAETIVRLGAALKTFAEYKKRLWEAAQRLFDGGADPAFITTFARSIDVELTKAWNEGSRTAGIGPDEMGEADAKVLSDIIASENQYILNLANDIRAAKEGGMEQEKFETAFGNRINVWANRYTDVVNQAILYWGKKERLIWRYGSRENHCDTCGQLNGIVAFGEEWSRVGLHPQRPPNVKLECGGWNCGCTLTLTKERRTRNAIKRLRAIAGAR